ncbi:MAG: hypothetical protein ACRDQF_02500 [Thermocrispum sp.]
MVFQQLPWLKPTGTNKMYNAELRVQGTSGDVRDFSMQPQHGDGSANAQHFAAVESLLDTLTETGRFVDTAAGGARWYDARYGVVDASTVAKVLDQFVWTANYSFKPHLAFLHDAEDKETRVDWVVLVALHDRRIDRKIGAYVATRY